MYVEKTWWSGEREWGTRADRRRHGDIETGSLKLFNTQRIAFLKKG